MPNATWSSIYYFRVDVDSILGSKSEPTVNLEYRAHISQQTSEDWNGVALTLSTAFPATGGEIPSLHPREITLTEKLGSKTPNHNSYHASAFARRVNGNVSSRPSGRQPGASDQNSTPTTRGRTRSSSTASIEGLQQNVRRHRRRNESGSRSTSPDTVVNQPPPTQTKPKPHISAPSITTGSKVASVAYEIEGLSTIPSAGAYPTVSVAVGLLFMHFWIAMHLSTSNLSCTGSGFGRKPGVGVCPTQGSICFLEMQR